MSLIRDLKLKIDDFQIDIPEWEIADQGITALTGPSGAGKTSIVKVLLGLTPCPGFSWKMGDVDVAQLPVEKRQLGVVFQNYLLFPHLTGRQNLTFAAEARAVPAAQVEEKLAAWSKILGLESCLDRRAEVLSGGEKQRVSLARALIGRPRFLILDEPFSAIDADLRSESRHWVKNLIALEGLPTLLISHDRVDVETLATSEFHLRAGRISRVGV
ncbi:MAG: ATP-binding cassette domain-containing protein [Bdellovibrionaceae bacterium]|nr:ATP-binding cassette domain-containing protein [Pseudobdellovibrionaceae bacterium]